MPTDAGADEIARALREAWSRGAVYADRSVPADVRDHMPTAASAGDDAGNVIAVVSGRAPGVTTIAIDQPLLWENSRRAVLVDADFAAATSPAWASTRAAAAGH
jgi:hypothetical protein